MSDFQNVLRAAKSVFLNETQKYQNDCQTEVLIDNEECFRAIVEWEKCTGELLVERPDFAPYRFVRLCVLSSTEEKSVFFWNDSDETPDEITEKIKTGFRAGLEYSKAMPV